MLSAADGLPFRSFSMSHVSLFPSRSRLFRIRTPMALGLLLSALVAAAGMGAADLPALRDSGLGALTLAIVIGMVVGNLAGPRWLPHVAPGVDFARSSLLRAGIVLYGFRITFGQILAVGWVGLLLDMVMVASTLGLAWVLGRHVFHLDRETTLLVGTGSAICGAAAVMGAEPVVRAPAHKVSIAVATVVVFGTLSMFVYPLLSHLPGLDAHAYGLYVGSSIHEVAQVVVAGHAVGEQAAATAVIEKMLRVMLLAPVLLVMGAWLAGLRRQEAGEGAAEPASRRVTVPWFVLAFMGVAGLHTLNWLSPREVALLDGLDTFVLAMAMAALGLRTHVSAVRQTGVRPLLLAASLWIYLMAGGYGWNRLLLALGA